MTLPEREHALLGRNSNYTYISGSWDGNVEVVDIPSSALVAGATYQARINPFTFRIPAQARLNFFYY